MRSFARSWLISGSIIAQQESARRSVRFVIRSGLKIEIYLCFVTPRLTMAGDPGSASDHRILEAHVAR